MKHSDRHYLFTSERLGFRTWSMDDLPDFADLCADPEVMQHFPKPLTTQETKEFIDRLIQHFETYGHCYYACEVKESGEFIGFIGLAYQAYQAPFTPVTDMGWRLKRCAWGKGYATEGALRCKEFAFKELNLDRIVAVCAENNANSENVMRKTGMMKMGAFDHPKLIEYPEHQRCIWYEAKNENM